MVRLEGEQLFEIRLLAQQRVCSLIGAFWGVEYAIQSVLCLVLSLVFALNYMGETVELSRPWWWKHRGARHGIAPAES